MTTNQRIGYGIVGLVQGLEDVYIALNDHRVAVRAVCDVDPQKHAALTNSEVGPVDDIPSLAGPAVGTLLKAVRQHPETRSIGYEADYEKLLARRDIDAVVLVVPDAMHEAMSIAALEAGKFVLCTKPMALTMESAINIAEAAQEHPGRYMVGFQMSYSPFARAVLGIVAAGEVGTVRQIRFDYHRGPWRPAHSRKHAAVDGAIMKEGTHWIDLIYRLNGRLPFTKVAGFSGLDVLGDRLEFEDNGTLIIQYEGFRAAHNFSYFRDARPMEDFMLVGEGGTLRGTFAELRLEGESTERTVQIPGHSLPHEHHRGYKQMHDEFVQMIAEGIAPYSDWRLGLENMLTCIAAQTAIAEQRTVTRKEFAASDWRLRYTNEA